MVLQFTGAAGPTAEPKKAAPKKRGKAKAAARADTSGDEAARSTARPAVSRVTRAQKHLDAASDTATTHAPKSGRKAASKPAVAEAVLEAEDPLAVEEEAGAELCDVAPRIAGRPASKHPAKQAPAVAPDRADSTAADASIGKVQGDSTHTLAALPAAGTQHRASKLSRKAAENASAAAEHAELDEDQTEASRAAAQAAPRKRGRKKKAAAAAAEACDASEINGAAKAGATEGGVKQKKKKRGRPAKQKASEPESVRHVRQKRDPAAAGEASRSVWEFDDGC